MNITSTEIKKARAYSGFGMNEIKEAITKHGITPLQACWYLHYSSLAVNIKGMDRHEWNMNHALERAEIEQENYDNFAGDNQC